MKERWFPSLSVARRPYFPQPVANMSPSSVTTAVHRPPHATCVGALDRFLPSSAGNLIRCGVCSVFSWPVKSKIKNHLLSTCSEIMTLIL